MSSNGQPFSMEEILALASSPAGQQLMQRLSKSDPEKLQKAAKQAAAEDWAGAKESISGLIEDPEIKKLLRQLGR